jgi:hypothetical protein
VTRHLFGGDIGGYVVAAGSSETVGSITGNHTLLVPGATVTFWTALSSGTQVTDLLDMTNAAITSVITDSNGAIPQLQGPATTPETWFMWADANGGSGPRRLVVGTDLDQKVDVSGDDMSGPLTVTSAQASSSVLSVTNNTSAPSVAAARVFSTSAGDRAVGVEVIGDANRRLAIDSNGKLAWGSGSGTQDVNWYRITVGVVGTDNTAQAGTFQGGTGSGVNLTLKSTSNATKGGILFGNSGYDEVNNRLGLGTSSPASVLDVRGSMALNLVSKTSSYTATTTDNVLLVSAASGNLTLTLPTAAGITGRIYTVKRTDSTTANTVTVATTSSQTIDGATTYTRLWDQNTYVQVISDGANWQMLDEHGIPEPWQSVALASQWSARGAGFSALRYRRLAGGTQVQWVGDATFTANGTTGLTSGGAVISAVPAAYRPTNEQHIWSSIAGGTGTPAITANRVPLAAIDNTGVLKTFNVTSNVTNTQTAIMQFAGVACLDA